MSTERKLVLDFLKLYSVKTADGRTLFDLSSGEQSSIYLDLKKTTLHNKIHVPLASYFVTLYWNLRQLHL